MNRTQSLPSRLRTLKTELENIGSDLLAIRRQMTEEGYDDKDIENMDQAAVCAGSASEWIGDSLEVWGKDDGPCTE